ncbi:MAG: helix-turn-helix transcriptional regulator [Planctomycetota bacterium]
MQGQLFPALLRYWRARRGVSQLDLALEAEVSSRHVSFLESGRAQPSEAMVLRLMSALHVPLRAQNEALRAAGFGPRFAEPALDAIAPELDAALTQMMRQQEPFPLSVLRGDFTLVRRNRAADAVFGAFVAEPDALPAELDMFALVFDPRFMRPFVAEWEAVARGMLSRLHREMLQRGGDARLAALLERVLAYPGVPAAWRAPDFSERAPATQSVVLERQDMRVGFLVTTTAFSAPQDVTVDELRVESCFPLDDATRRVCEQLAAGGR